MIGIILILLLGCFELLIGPSIFDGIIVTILIVLCLVNYFRGKSYTKKITPTMHFIISCCYLTNVASETDDYEIGGMPKGTVPKLKIKRAFKGPWGIKNKRKFNETIQWLQEEGHNKGCLEEMEQYRERMDECPNPELFQKLLDYYPEKGIMAWDDMIANYLTGLWYWSGSKEKMTGRKEWYDSRKNMAESLLYKGDFKVALDENDVIKQRTSVFL